MSSPLPFQTESFTTADGTSLFYRLLVPENPRAWVVLVHGLAEHSGRYLHVMEAFYKAGYAVLAGDHRGHGKSSGKRVFVERFSDYVKDLESLIEKVCPKDARIALLGHSMGGLIAIHHALIYTTSSDFLMLSSPGLGIKVPVPAWKEALGRAMSKLWPGLSIPTGIGPALISRDPAVVEAYKKDPLVTSNATARWFTEFVNAQKTAFLEAPALKAPCFMQYGGSDGIVAVKEEERWFELLGSSDKSLKEWPNLLHEIMNEPEKAEVIKAYVNWLNDKTG